MGDRGLRGPEADCGFGGLTTENRDRNEAHYDWHCQKPTLPSASTAELPVMPPRTPIHSLNTIPLHTHTLTQPHTQTQPLTSPYTNTHRPKQTHTHTYTNYHTNSHTLTHPHNK